MRYFGIPTKEARDAVYDAGLLGTIANLDDVAPFVHLSVVSVDFRRRNGRCSQGSGYRSEKGESEG